MPELTAYDVESYTKGRLKSDDVETVRTLKRAYAAVRMYCGWHVSPQRTDVVTLDGPGWGLLALPTTHLVSLTSVVEDGVTLNVSDLTPSATGRLLTKRTYPMRWSCNYRSIVVTMVHGFDVAPDFDQAVLEAIDCVTLKVGTGSNSPIKRYRVDDVEREWQHANSNAEYESGLNEPLLEQYRLTRSI